MKKEDIVKASSIQTKITPSYLLQNLTCSTNFIAYANLQGDNKRVVVIKIKQDQLSKDYDQVISDNQDTITDLKYLYVKNEWRLIVAGFLGFRIYSEDGKTCISIQKVIHDKSFAESQFYLGGITCMKCSDTSETICLGSSNGQIYFSECLGSSKFQTYVGLSLEKSQKITCLAASQTDHILITATTEGQLNLFLSNSLKDIICLKKIDSNEKQKIPITSLAVLERKLLNKTLSNFLVSGDYIGQIKIYDLNEYCLLTQINSHVRMITQIDCNHCTSEILSGSEDSFINVWKPNIEGSEVSLSFSLSINDLCIVGANFFDKCSSNSPIYVTCYEQEEIHVIFRKQ